jgi:hypothetical protein
VLRWEEPCNKRIAAVRETTSEGESTMQKSRFIAPALTVLALLLSMAVTSSSAQDNKLVGTWKVTLEANSGGGAAEQGGGGGGTETLTISQEGGKYKVIHKSHRGDQTCDAMVDGNNISWTEQRKTHNGDTVKVNYNATLNGDTLNGSYQGGPYERGFNAKRSR